MKLKYCLFALLVLPILSLAQGTSRGVVSLKLPTTPFIGATGESFVADPRSLQSLLINPANIASRESYDMLFSHTEWIQDVRTEFLSIAAPFRYGSLAFSISNTSVDDIPYRLVPGPPIGTFNAQSSNFQLTYGVRVTDNVNIGITPKYHYEKIFVDEATGWGIDIGTLYTSPVQGLTLGLSVTDIGSLSAFRKDETDFSSQLRMGGTYSFAIDELTFRTAAAFTSELGISVTHLSLGGEAIYQNTFSLRLGYKTGYAFRDFSAGLGLRYSLLSVDYAFVPWSAQMGNAHIISIGFVF